MQRNSAVFFFLLALCLLFFCIPCFSSCLLLTPIQPAPSVIYPDQVITASYLVTNQSTLTLNNNGLSPLPPGVTQIVQSGTCSSTFNLAPNQSCILLLQITSNELQGNLIGGPRICNPQTNPTYCSAPAAGNQFNVVKPPISVPSTAVIPVNDPTGVSITVTNLTNNPITNVTADLSATDWAGVTSSTCAELPANGTCTLTFISNTATPYIAQTGIVISGDNVSSPPTIALAFSMSGYLVFSTTGPSPGSAKVIYSSDNSTALPWDSTTSCLSPTNSCITTSATSLTDGSTNTSTIVSALNGQDGVTATNYAAEICYNITSDNSSPSLPNGTWYLPAICEFGASGQSAGCASGTANIFSNLYFNNSINFGNFGNLNYWSSTENDDLTAWYQFLPPMIGPQQAIYDKAATFGVRCVRVFTY